MPEDLIVDQGEHGVGEPKEEHRVMQDYNLALFVHLLGVIGLFSATAVRLAVLFAAVRAPSVAIVRVYARLAILSDRVMPVAGVATIGSGAYLVHELWRWDMAWIQVSLAAVLAMFFIGPVVSSRKLTQLARDADLIDDGPVPTALTTRINDPVLHLAEHVMTFAMLGIVYLMATKPPMPEAIATILVAAFAGVLLTGLALLTAPARRPQTLIPPEATSA